MKTTYHETAHGQFSTRGMEDVDCLVGIRAVNTEHADQMNVLVSAIDTETQHTEGAIVVALNRLQVIALRDFLSFCLNLPV